MPSQIPHGMTLRWFLLTVVAGIIGGIAFDQLKRRGWYT